MMNPLVAWATRRGLRAWGARTLEVAGRRSGALRTTPVNVLVLDGAIASSESQRTAFWRLREEQPEGQRLEGPQLKHDIAVPSQSGRRYFSFCSGVPQCSSVCMLPSSGAWQFRMNGP